MLLIAMVSSKSLRAAAKNLVKKRLGTCRFALS
jgi:hypothetical protein